MRKIDQEEFDRLEFDRSPKDCVHPEVVRIYYQGSHIDYGCVACGLSHTNKRVFDKPGLEGYK